MLIKELESKLNIICQDEKDYYLRDFIKALIDYSLESGVTIEMLRGQLLDSDDFIENFTPEYNDLHRVKSLCEVFKSDKNV